MSNIRKIMLVSLSVLLVMSTLLSFLPGSSGKLDPDPVSVSPTTSAKSSFKVGDQVISVKKMVDIPLPNSKPAKVSLPRLDSMTKLLGIFNKMGLVYEPSENDEMMRVKESTNKVIATEMATAMPAASAAPDVVFGAADTGSAYSQTNTQVTGVDEGDLIKTDGKYIYSANGQKIRIIETSGADMRVIGEIILPQDENAWENFSEMYIAGDRLVTVSTRNETVNEALYNFGPMVRAAVDCVWYPQRQFTAYTVYNISDRSNPVETRKFEVEGNALATRLIGDNLYFVSLKYIYAVPADDMGEPDILPMYRDSEISDEMYVVPVSDVAYIPGSMETTYMMAGAFDITGTEEVSMETILGAGGTVYMSRDALYVAHQVYENTGKLSTEIHRFTVDGAGLYYSGMGAVDGYPLNQYSMDEYNGHFRIATSDWDGGNRMTVLDGDLKVVGKTEDLAQGEQIYSVRFMGDIGYMVTYRQTDPLFAVDLSDPANPTVLGQLKIPGFSQYLHPVGDGLLMGFGRHTTETYIKHEDGTEEVVGTRDMGMKISLFDVSNPRDPKEIDVILLGENMWTSAFDNPRALMVDPSRRLFGFAMEGGKTQSNGAWTQESGFTLVSVNERKLSLEASLLEDTQNGSYYFNCWSARLCFIGNTLYGVSENRISAYDYTSYNKLGSLTLE